MIYEGKTFKTIAIYVRIENSISVQRRDIRRWNAIDIKRSFEELVSFLYCECTFPHGSFLMTGTGIVPGSDFTLKSNDLISITIDGIGTLQNSVA